MPASLPPARRRRRPRRGSLERPVNGRLYRVSAVAAVVPLLLLAFTISSPSPLVKPALPETFDTAAAVALTRDLATVYPDRAPGSTGAGDARPLSGASAWFDQQLEGYGLRLSASSWSENVPGRGRVRLTNIAAVAPGQSPEVIVVMAHRDDLGTGPGANDDASGTAVLIELARAYAEPHGVASASVESAHTLVFLSTDGDSFGELGAVHFLASSPFRHRIAAVVNLDALAGGGSARIVIAGDRPRSPSPALFATASARIAEQTGGATQHANLLGQLIDLGFPFTLYAQGPFIAAGIPAVTLTTAGDRPPPGFGDDPGDLRDARLGEMGEAAQALLGSLDQDLELAPATASEVWVGARMIRGWAIELLLVSLLVPFAVTVVDLYALCRRNRIGFGAAVKALRRRLGFWLFAGIVFTCFGHLGVWSTGPARPPNPSNPLTTHVPIPALLALLMLLAGAWAIARFRLAVRRPVTPEEQLAGTLVALVALFLVALLVAATNAFALLFLLPALHTWLWLPQLRIARAPVRVVLYLLGLVAPALILASLAWRFRLGFDAVWYLLRLISSGYVSTLAFGVALASAAAASQLAVASAGRYAPYPEPRAAGHPGAVRALARFLYRHRRGAPARRIALRR